MVNSMSEQQAGFLDDVPIISSYSRAQAIEDGVLVDVTEYAKADGFKWPTCLTRGLYDAMTHDGKWEDDGKGSEVLTGVDMPGRFHDLFWMLHLAIKASRGGDEVYFKFLVAG